MSYSICLSNPIFEESAVPAAAQKDRLELLAARKGNSEAGVYLMSRHAGGMLRTAWRVLGRYGGNESEDIVQEAFVAALTTSSLPQGDVGAWLRTITARKALDWLRKAKRRPEASLAEDDSLAEPRQSGNPEATLDILAVRQGLSRLSAKDRAVLTLVDLEGHSMAEVAKALGSTRAAVKLRAMRARRKLADALRSG